MVQISRFTNYHSTVPLTGERFLHNSVESLANEYINQLKIVLPEGPYILGGHSFGGNLAYEMAIQLQKSGDEVPLLVIFDSTGPYPFVSFPWHRSIKKFLRIIDGMTVSKLSRYIKMCFYNSFFLLRKPLPKKYWVEYTLTNYFILLYKYRPEKLNGDILLFKPGGKRSICKYDNGWESLCSKLTIVEFEGNHMSVFRKKENIELWLKKLRSILLIP